MFLNDLPMNGASPLKFHNEIKMGTKTKPRFHLTVPKNRIHSFYNIKNIELSKMDKLNYRLDRTAFQALTFEEADKQINYSKDLNEEDRINQFNYLMSVAFGFLNDDWPKMDRSHFKKIKRN